MKLNVGSGLRRYEGFLNCDLSVDVKADYVFDAERARWPFEDNSVEEIKTENLLEHFHSLDNFMNEAWRVLKSGGKLVVLVPHYRHFYAYYDPDHIRYFTEQSMIYWSRNTKGSDGIPVVRGPADFDVISVTRTVDQSKLENFPKDLQDFMLEHSWNVIQFLKFELKAVKPAREF